MFLECQSSYVHVVLINQAHMAEKFSPRVLDHTLEVHAGIFETHDHPGILHYAQHQLDRCKLRGLLRNRNRPIPVSEVEGRKELMICQEVDDAFQRRR
jgi:hypothetical protein